MYTQRVFEWDPLKDLQNRRKHQGISFDAAALVFDDKFCLVDPDRSDSITGELRWHALGQVKLQPDSASILLVVHVYRTKENGKEIIRIISARVANKKELRRYQKQELE